MGRITVGKMEKLIELLKPKAEEVLVDFYGTLEQEAEGWKPPEDYPYGHTVIFRLKGQLLRVKIMHTGPGEDDGLILAVESFDFFHSEQGWTKLETVGDLEKPFAMAKVYDALGH